MRFTPLSLAAVIAIALLCAPESYAAPFATGNSNNEVQVAFDILSKTMKQSAAAIARVQEATFHVMHTHASQLASFPATFVPLNRKLQQMPPPTPPVGPPSGQTCPGAITAACQSPPTAALTCLMKVFSAAAGNPMASPFSVPAIMCQLQMPASNSSACVNVLIQYFKTCACIDMQPLFNLVCPNAPTASPCARSAFVQRFLALATDSTLGFFGDTVKSFDFPSPTEAANLDMCGDVESYRRTVLINGLGSCLYAIIDAFPVPTFMTGDVIPGTNLNMATMIKGSLRCALTQPSYRFQTYCSGNIGKCFSLPLSSFPSCRGATSTTCPAGCKNEIAAYGAATSSNSAKCCIKWFQQQIPSTCSTAPSITISQFMGPECISFVKTMVAANPSPNPMPDAMWTMPFLPAPCPASSTRVAVGQNCNVPVTLLEPACAADTTPFVLASLFAPKKTTTATIVFSSSSLKAVLVTKYAETLAAIKKALEDKLTPGTIVEPISVVAQIGSRRLLQDGNGITATVSLSTTAQMSATADPKVALQSVTGLQAALDSALTAAVGSPVTTSAVTSTASSTENAPTPLAEPAAANSPPVAVSSASAAGVVIQLVLLCAAVLL